MPVKEKEKEKQRFVISVEKENRLLKQIALLSNFQHMDVLIIIFFDAIVQYELRSLFLELLKSLHFTNSLCCSSKAASTVIDSNNFCNLFSTDTNLGDREHLLIMT